MFRIPDKNNDRELWIKNPYTRALARSLTEGELKAAKVDLEAACAKSSDPAVAKAFARFTTIQETIDSLQGVGDHGRNTDDT